LAVLLWFALYVFTWQWVFDLVWSPQAKLAARLSGKYGDDGPALPLPLIAWVAIFAIPTLAVGALGFLYRVDTRKSPQRIGSQMGTDRHRYRTED
jgi:hypothetical protein